MQKITTFLMFEDHAIEAVNFYVSVFKNSKILSTMPGPNGTDMGATFQLDGEEFIAYNGGPHFSFSQGMSLFVKAGTQDEIDELYETLSEGGEKQPCGWLKDQYGLSWQVVPAALSEMMASDDEAAKQRAMRAVLAMSKLEVAAIQRAFDGT